MEAATSYLYGDSTPSPLTTDFVAFLRDVFDFASEVLASDARLTEAMDRIGKLADSTEKEIQRAEAFALQVSRMLDPAEGRDPDSLAARCAARIRQGAVDLVRSESEAARAGVASERARALQTAATEHGASAKAVQTLLLRHPLPETVSVINVRLEANARYEARARCRTPYGLDWVLELEVPGSHALASVLRVDRVAPRLEVDAPEEAGWIHKEVKIRAQRFDRFYLAELTIAPAETTARLRTNPDGTGAGFDVLFASDTGRARLLRVLEAGATPDSPYDVAGDDLGKLQALREALTALVADLRERRKSVVSMTLDDGPLDQLEAPRLLVDRLVANIAPTVQEIVKRSLVPGELVLKRLLGDNHREELFVSKAELYRKIEPLPPSLRRVFDPLGLWDSHGPAAPPAAPTQPGGQLAPAPQPQPETDGQLTPQPVQMVSQPPPAAEPPAPEVGVIPAAPHASATTSPLLAQRMSSRPPRP
ncbi:MAG TPA: hypothetical protein VKU41_18865 [Polyangiaceae bacterium]|nr:hypothetical protein [Polyangiaceae bacterium]